MSTLEVWIAGYQGYARYLWAEVTQPHRGNAFYWLIGLSLVFFALEQLWPWRRAQPRLRRDFWLDTFYLFFNSFLFSLLVYNAAAEVVVYWLRGGLQRLGIESLVLVDVRAWPAWAQLLTLFVVRDFVHWNIHRLLHRVPWLWELHKVHHSVVQMGFAAHLRYHWAENVLYRALEYLPLALIGFGLRDFFVMHAFTLAIGHFNHANWKIELGPLRYILNHPQMHIWHHARALPAGHVHGINYGLTLSLWDWLFGTACIPEDGRDLELGFEGIEAFPAGFIGQFLYGPWRTRAQPSPPGRA